MHCTSCGQQNHADARFCQNCGRELPSQESAGGGYQPAGIGEPRPYVPNHLVWAILATIFCCLPTGIAAIVYAAQVNGLLNAGDYDAARRASDSAKTWALVSVPLGLAVGAIWFYMMNFS